MEDEDGGRGRTRHRRRASRRPQTALIDFPAPKNMGQAKDLA